MVKTSFVINQLIDLLESVETGRTLQTFRDGDLVDVNVSTLNELDLNSDYRLKPIERKLRRYKSRSEFCNDMQKHGLYLSKKNDTSAQFFPIKIDHNGVVFYNDCCDDEDCCEFYSYEELFACYVWVDGSPCGILESINNKTIKQ